MDISRRGARGWQPPHRAAATGDPGQAQLHRQPRLQDGSLEGALLFCHVQAAYEPADILGDRGIKSRDLLLRAGTGRELAWARMETDLANAQLQALNMQLHPHFLFNTLHSISTLISEDPAVAQAMVLQLSDLLRATLSKIETPEVPLQQELELLNCYLSIEQTRFKDRLNIRQEIDPATLPCAVPTMILQPLVENAVRHGIGKHKQADEISILGRRENGCVLLEVRNRVGRMENGVDTPRGIGLANTRARLEQLYSDAHSFEIADREGGGVAVKLSFPASDDQSAAYASKA